jgi:hypothetical protein
VDREKVAELLRTAAVDGRISLDELSERLELAYDARTYRDLEPLLLDLPRGGPGVVPFVPPAVPATPAPAGAGSLARVGGVSNGNVAVAIMSGATRKGVWTVPASFSAVAVMGGVELDLREARFETREVTIQAVAFWGGIDITVPDDVTVHVDGVAIMGGFDGPRDDTARGGGVVVRVTGFALMGGVDVRRKTRKGKRPDSGPSAIER